MVCIYKNLLVYIYYSLSSKDIDHDCIQCMLFEPMELEGQ